MAGGTTDDGDDEMQDAMEPEEEEDIEAILAAMPEVSLDIFDVVKSSRAQHGLRHGDYLRYRQYCARRLHRLRKSLKLTQGKGRFVKKPIEPRVVAQGKHLLIPLYCSERAWAYAMQLKRESSQVRGSTCTPALATRAPTLRRLRMFLTGQPAAEIPPAVAPGQGREVGENAERPVRDERRQARPLRIAPTARLRPPEARPSPRAMPPPATALGGRARRDRAPQRTKGRAHASR